MKEFICLIWEEKSETWSLTTVDNIVLDFKKTEGGLSYSFVRTGKGNVFRCFAKSNLSMNATTIRRWPLRGVTLCPSMAKTFLSTSSVRIFLQEYFCSHTEITNVTYIFESSSTTMLVSSWILKKTIISLGFLSDASNMRWWDQFFQNQSKNPNRKTLR